MLMDHVRPCGHHWNEIQGAAAWITTRASAAATQRGDARGFIAAVAISLHPIDGEEPASTAVQNLLQENPTCRPVTCVQARHQQARKT
jgi:hypothetical protein